MTIVRTIVNFFTYNIKLIMKEVLFMYFLRRFSADVHQLHRTLQGWNRTKKMVLVSLLASVAAVLQSAGGYIPIFGFFISPFTTLPIMIATLISLRYGFFPTD